MFRTILLITCFIHCIFAVEVKNLTTTPVSTVFSSTWDDASQSVYFVGFLTSGTNHSIFRYCASTGKFYSAYIEGKVSPSFIVPTEEQNVFIVGDGHDGLMVRWDGLSEIATVSETLFSVETNNQLSRMGTARVDPLGRLYFGTFPQNFCAGNSSFASIYQYNKIEGVKQLFGGLQTTSGIAFNLLARKMYQLDTCTLLLREFDYNLLTGDIENERILIDFTKQGKNITNFVPVGLEIDSLGSLFLVEYSGTLYKVEPSERVSYEVMKLPVKGVTGVTLGRNVLYVIAGFEIINVATATPVEQADDGTSMVAVTGLNGVFGTPSKRALI